MLEMLKSIYCAISIICSLDDDSFFYLKIVFKRGSKFGLQKKKSFKSSSNVSKMEAISELHALLPLIKMGDDIVKMKK
jgi:hypothetical protein